MKPIFYRLILAFGLGSAALSAQAGYICKVDGNAVFTEKKIGNDCTESHTDGTANVSPEEAGRAVPERVDLKEALGEAAPEPGDIKVLPRTTGGSVTNTAEAANPRLDIKLRNGKLGEATSVGDLKAAKARAAEFVRALPAGLDTQLGEQWGGVGLSGGQWQRLALARLILRNTALWILDEPTSAIDAHAEEQIFATLRKVAADHMTILVSHRAWTLKHADVIHVVDHGTIVESGTYAELLGAGGRFAEIFASQIEDAPEHTPSDLPVADGAGSTENIGSAEEGTPSC